MENTIFITSLVSNRTKKPLVELNWGSERAQLSAKEAIDHAHIILAAAEAAQTDAYLVEFFVQRLDCPKETALSILADFRKYREAMDGERNHPVTPKPVEPPPAKDGG